MKYGTLGPSRHGWSLFSSEKEKKNGGWNEKRVPEGLDESASIFFTLVQQLTQESIFFLCLAHAWLAPHPLFMTSRLARC